MYEHGFIKVILPNKSFHNQIYQVKKLKATNIKAQLQRKSWKFKQIWIEV